MYCKAAASVLHSMRTASRRPGHGNLRRHRGHGDGPAGSVRTAPRRVEPSVPAPRRRAPWPGIRGGRRGARAAHPPWREGRPPTPPPARRRRPARRAGVQDQRRSGCVRAAAAQERPRRRSVPFPVRSRPAPTRSAAVATSQTAPGTSTQPPTTQTPPRPSLPRAPSGVGRGQRPSLRAVIAIGGECRAAAARFIARPPVHRERWSRSRLPPRRAPRGSRAPVGGGRIRCPRPLPRRRPTTRHRR